MNTCSWLPTKGNNVMTCDHKLQKSELYIQVHASTYILAMYTTNSSLLIYYAYVT